MVASSNRRQTHHFQAALRTATETSEGKPDMVFQKPTDGRPGLTKNRRRQRRALASLPPSGDGGRRSRLGLSVDRGGPGFAQIEVLLAHLITAGTFDMITACSIARASSECGTPRRQSGLSLLCPAYVPR